MFPHKNVRSRAAVAPAQSIATQTPQYDSKTDKAKKEFLTSQNFAIAFITAVFVFAFLFTMFGGEPRVDQHKQKWSSGVSVSGGQRQAAQLKHKRPEGPLHQRNPKAEFLSFRPQYEDYDLVILYYSPLFGINAQFSFLKSDIGDHMCSFKDEHTGQMVENVKVLLTGDKTLDDNAHAYVFHGPDSGREAARVRTDDAKDVYIYHTMESPALTSGSMRSEVFMNDYNLLMSYHFNADIFLPYIGRGTLQLLVDRPILVPFKEKNQDAPLAWIGSNCGAQNGRQEYLQELFDYIPTHSYGSCLSNMKEHVGRGDAMMNKVAEYKFYIVMENSNCEDYITEKLGTAIIASTVPVVFSPDGDKPNYDRYMPPHSYINAADFPSPETLATYLKRVASNETLYNSYLQYKFNSVTESGKKKQMDEILQRYQHKETKNHWCRAAAAVWNHLKKGDTKRLSADNSCLDSNSMHAYTLYTRKPFAYDGGYDDYYEGNDDIGDIDKPEID